MRAISETFAYLLRFIFYCKFRSIFFHFQHIVTVLIFTFWAAKLQISPLIRAVIQRLVAALAV